ncbi:transcription-silencing protein Clr2-domain-containing protein [Rhypophila decipiens]|uniref:Transcription-silencing protein Clr2-domain-containing protein n=1 Tax=Rhypophila decipiens TaxID=261697 RepID=A0AAN7B528_9PEZI|nr:transcription-silencing protein Clr2-domain-containing protein [Rhypophila decipiens]
MANKAAEDEYYPVKIHRTDSTGYSNLDHNALNPKEDQDIQQQERWEVILGGHLTNQVAPPDEKRQFKLDGFPKGYELRCAIRRDGGRDYYLYGHPAGPKATYRTPGDFVMHLLWLASTSNDRSDCSCDLCARMAKRLEALAQAQAHVQPQPQAQAQAQPQPVRPSTQQPQFQNQQPPPQPQTQLQPQAPPVQAAPRPPPQPAIPGVKSPANVFRLGEMVWYKHQAWRLGVIVSIEPTVENVEGDDSKYTFTLAPLGHLSLNLPAVPKPATDMRPFLTFSVPDISIPGLVGKKFEGVDWPAYAMQSRGNERQMQTVGLEASKMGARSINDSYSTINLLTEGITPDGLYVIQTYKAVYFGAEMICTNDPIRVTTDHNTMAPDHDNPNGSSAVMLVSEIQVMSSPNEPNITPPSLSFKGSIYLPVRAQLPHPPNMVPPETLGPVFTEEMSIRNQIEQDKTTVRWGWALIEENTIRSDVDVQGRFYVNHKLMNIVDPDKFQQSARNGVVQEALAYLNSRGQSGYKEVLVRKKHRAEALGEAVSVQFVPPEGMIEN